MKEHSMNCSVCGTKLNNPESMIAGIGPVCFEKVLFSQILTSDELLTLERQRETFGEKHMNRFILVNTGPEVFVGVPLKKQGDHTLFFNRKKSYQQKDKNLAKTFADAFEYVKDDEIEYVSFLTKSSSPDIRRASIFLGRTLKKELQVVEDLQKNHFEMGLNEKHYQVVASRKEMTPSQIGNREALMQIKEDDPALYQSYWKNGVPHRLTLMYRLKNVKYYEASSFFDFLEQGREGYDNQTDLAFKDYGLTDEEIMNGLKHSRQQFEASLYKAFVSQNPNFLNLLKIAQNYDKIKKETKRPMNLVFLKLLNSKKKISNDELKELYKQALS